MYVRSVKKKEESVSQNLIIHGYKICDSCKLSKTIFLSKYKKY